MLVVVRLYMLLVTSNMLMLSSHKGCCTLQCFCYFVHSLYTCASVHRICIYLQTCLIPTHTHLCFISQALSLIQSLVLLTAERSAPSTKQSLASLGLFLSR